MYQVSADEEMQILEQGGADTLLLSKQKALQVTRSAADQTRW